MNLKNEISIRENFMIIIFICLVSFLTRIVIIPFDIPLKLDGLEYYVFSYNVANNLNYSQILGTNDGWSWFLSFFFMIFRDNDFITLSNIQRVVSTSLSVITFLPIFLIGKKIFNTKMGLIAGTIFIFSPHIIKNSILGITEPLFILTVSIALYFLIENKSRSFIFIMISLAVSTIIRYEGLIIIIPILIFYFLRLNSKNRNLKVLFFGFLIFLLIISPVLLLRIEYNGNDGVISHIIGAVNYDPSIEKSATSIKNNDIFSQFIQNSISNLIKYSLYISIPFFIIFLPLGIFKILRKRNIEINKLLIITIFLIIPSLYAYGRDISETRYLLIILPVFSIVSIYGINSIHILNRRTNLLLIIIILGGLLFLILDSEDYTDVKEKYAIAKILVRESTGVNNYDGATLLKAAELEINWPSTLRNNHNGEITTRTIRYSIDGYQNLQEFIEINYQSGLSHIVIINDNYPKFMDELLKNPESFNNVEKIFDSREEGFRNKIIIYKINYIQFD